MKIYFLTVLFFLISCTSKQSQVYICGDHPCKNKQEMRDYFKNNISIEVYTITTEKDKKESLDLVELNLLKDDLTNKNDINESLSKPKSKKDIEKLIKERKKMAKLKVKTENNSIKDINTKKIKEKKILKPKKTKPVTFVRLCKNIEECDIDKISKIIMDMGKEKPFPDITTQ